MISEILKISASIIASVGVAGGIIFSLSNWLGNIWANRIMETEKAKYALELEKLRADLYEKNESRLNVIKSDLDIYKEKHLKTHKDKLETYRMGADMIASLLVGLEKHTAGSLAKDEGENLYYNFNRERIKLYAYLGMMAPQSVMDAQDVLIDHLLVVLHGKQEYDRKLVRKLSIDFLNSVRIDLGIDSTPINYQGVL
jgi:hypothetical protein